MLPKKPWLAPTALGLTTSAPHRPASLQPGQKDGKLNFWDRSRVGPGYQ